MTLPAVGIGIAAAVASAAAYGITVVYARMAALQGASAGDLVLLRVVLMLGAVAAYAAATAAPLRLPRPGRGAVLLLGMTSAGCGLTYLFAVSFVPVSVAAVIFYTFPLLILAASPFVDGERFTAGRAAVFVVAFAGLAIAIGPAFGGVDWRGIAFAAGGSMLAACQFFAAARAGARASPAALLFWSHVVILPIAGTVALAAGTGPASALAAGGFAAAMTVLGYLAGFALQMLAARRAAPALVGLIFCLEPVVSIAGAAAILGERLGPSQMLGSALVLAALVASSLRELRRAPAPAVS